MESPSQKPLTAATLHILLALAAGDLHGYGIIQEVSRESGGNYRIGPGTLYDNLRKLLDAGLVVDVPQSALAPDEERRMYSLSTDGRQALEAEVDRMQKVVKEARERLRKPKTA
jgi:DNA-binding PadR family transcriptional regulator